MRNIESSIRVLETLPPADTTPPTLLLVVLRALLRKSDRSSRIAVTITAQCVKSAYNRDNSSSRCKWNEGGGNNFEEEELVLHSCQPQRSGTVDMPPLIHWKQAESGNRYSLFQLTKPSTYISRDVLFLKPLHDSVDITIYSNWLVERSQKTGGVLY